MQRLWIVLLVLLRTVMLGNTLSYVAVNQLRPVHTVEFDDQMYFRFKKIKRDRGYQRHLYACHDDRDCGPGLVCQTYTYGRYCSLTVPVNR